MSNDPNRPAAETLASPDAPNPAPKAQKLSRPSRAKPRGCYIPMSDEEPCGRPIRPTPSELDPVPVCLMHSSDPNKDLAPFRHEINAILASKSIYNRPKDTFDFTHFVFPIGDFTRVKFTQNARFDGATFTRSADFSMATFTQNAFFNFPMFTGDAVFHFTKFTQDTVFNLATFTQDAIFRCAKFTQDADFTGAEFIQNANFASAKFTQNAHFNSAMFKQNAFFPEATFTGIADFSYAHFQQPQRVLFERVNAESDTGLKARFRNCLLDGVRFEDVNWHRERGRIFLQDEADLAGTPDSPPTATHELVADAYRRLVNNFEKTRAYELAEECVIGEMEMRRLNPRKWLFATWVEPSAVLERWIRYRWIGWFFYLLSRVRSRIGTLADRIYKEQQPLARWLGAHFSMINFYRFFSRYGSSYVRALAWLVFFLLVLFPFLFAWSGIRPADPASAVRQVTPRFAPLPDPLISWSQACCARGPGGNRSIDLVYTYRSALLATLEVITFQKERTFVPAHWEGKMAAALLLAAASGQLTLLLLALRRRFRR